jgi:hypothetical protein
MKTKLVAFVSIVICSAYFGSLVTLGDDKVHSENSALAQFAQLAGEWVGKGTHGDAAHDARASYRVTAGGSAVVETIDPGGEHEMITVIHQDGDSLLLTHYCMLGNQPQMRAQSKPGDKKVAFEFVKATNLKSDKDMYMHNVTFTFVDKDTLKAEWTNYNEGKNAGTAVFEMKRKK